MQPPVLSLISRCVRGAGCSHAALLHASVFHLGHIQGLPPDSHSHSAAAMVPRAGSGRLSSELAPFLLCFTLDCIVTLSNTNAYVAFENTAVALIMFFLSTVGPVIVRAHVFPMHICVCKPSLGICLRSLLCAWVRGHPLTSPISE